MMNVISSGAKSIFIMHCVRFILIAGIFLSIDPAIRAQSTEAPSVPEIPSATEVADETERVSEAEKKEQIEQQKRETIWIDDSKTIFSLVSELRKYREKESDSSVQERKKKQLLATDLDKLNQKSIGTSVKLSAAFLEDVTIEKEISKHGIKKLQALRRQIENDPKSKAYIDALGDDWASNPLFAFTLGFYLAGCEKCFRETGRYLAKYSIKKLSMQEYGPEVSGIKDFEANELDKDAEMVSTEEKTISIDIIKVITSENEALKLPKGRNMPLTGKIALIQYDGSKHFEKITIHLK